MTDAGAYARLTSLKINGREIMFGGQIADYIRVKLVGLAHEFGQHKTQPRDCEGAPPDAEVAAFTASAPPASGSARILRNLVGSVRA